MDILLIIAGSICLLVGLAGCFLPVLPGPPVSYVGLLLLHFTDRVQFSASELVLWGVLVVIIQILDYVTPLWGAKYSGGGKWGNWGCAIGMVAGIFLFPPWGVLVGPFVGAFVGELLVGKPSADALKAGLGAFVGFLFSVVIKVALCGYFVYCFVAALWN